MLASIAKLLGKVVSNWTTGLNFRKSCIVVFSAALGAIISMFIEFGARGQNESVMIVFREFLGFIFDTPISNPATAFAIVVIGVALCFIFQMKTALAALYGGATVITILTTGLPQGQPTAGNVNDESSPLLNYAVARNHEALQGRRLLLWQIATTEPSLVFCPDDRSPYYGQVEVLWIFYGNNGAVEQYSMNAFVDRGGTTVPLPPQLKDDNNRKYELTVKSPDMKTINTSGSTSRIDKRFSIKITTENGENTFFEWAFQFNVQSGNSENLSRCDLQ